MAKFIDQLMFDNWEPKLTNRFIMIVDGIPAYLIKASSRPKNTSEKVTIDHINVQRYTKGKTVWEPIDITLYDPISPSGMQAAMEWIRLSHESVTGADGYSDFYKKDVIIKILGPLGDVVERWTLKGAWITNMDGGSLDFSDGNSLLNIQLGLSYDYAILEF